MQNVLIDNSATAAQPTAELDSMIALSEQGHAPETSSNGDKSYNSIMNFGPYDKKNTPMFQWDVNRINNQEPLKFDYDFGGVTNFSFSKSWNPFNSSGWSFFKNLSLYDFIPKTNSSTQKPRYHLKLVDPKK